MGVLIATFSIRNVGVRSVSWRFSHILLSGRSRIAVLKSQGACVIAYQRLQGEISGWMRIQAWVTTNSTPSRSSLQAQE
jgi:hypothetical protein